MSTSEYAVGTLGTAMIACGVQALADSGWVSDLLSRIFEAVLASTLPELLGWAP